MMYSAGVWSTLHTLYIERTPVGLCVQYLGAEQLEAKKMSQLMPPLLILLSPLCLMMRSSSAPHVNINGMQVLKGVQVIRAEQSNLRRSRSPRFLHAQSNVKLVATLLPEVMSRV